MTPGSQHDAAMARGARCDLCPLANTRQGPVMPEVRPSSILAVVEESPSSTEVEDGRLFVGNAADITWNALGHGGVTRAETTVTATILCRPPGGHIFDYTVDLTRQHKRANKGVKPLPVLHTPQACCEPRLRRDLEESGARHFLAVGSETLKPVAHFLGLPYAKEKAGPGDPRVASLKKQHGSPVTAKDGRVLHASMSPGFALAGNATMLPIIRADITRAAVVARRGHVDWSEPTFVLKPSDDVCVNVMLAMQASGAVITVDIETNSANVLSADIRCVGLGCVIDGKEIVIVVPLKHIDGRPWWSPGQETRIKRVMTDLLEANPLSGHNLLFDTAVLLEHSLMQSRGKKWFDTMIAHHCTSHSELPHDLGFVAARFFESPRWKENADAKVVDGVDDYWLHLYCARDVLGEMRLIPPLAEMVGDEGTAGALGTDLELAPVARDMGVLGLNINETERRKYFDILDRMMVQRSAELRSITGRDHFNPNAFKQVAQWLFVEKGLSPPYATDGREWQELAEDDEVDIDTEDPEVILAKASTNELALLRLLELGVDAQTAKFIDTLLAYRGVQKCAGTYIGLKWEEDDNGQRVLVDTHRKRGFMRTENHGGALNNLSILHASWKVHVTPTGRWATSPNVQNWPERVVYDTDLYKATDGKDGIINTRRMVQAPPGYILVGADYAAIELRLYAIMAQDVKLMDAIMNGKDPHSLNYATMMARHPGEVDKWYERIMTGPAKVKKYLRLIAKRFGFLVIYGGQKDKLYRTMAADRNPDGTRSFPDLKPGDVEMWFDNWHRGHPETRKWQEAVVRAWTAHGFVGTLLDGRRRFFIGGPDPTAMPNMTIQGSAASIMNRAMKTIARECPHRGWGPLAGPILQVHDYVGLQVPIERQKDAEDLLNTAMPWEHNGMKFEVEQKSGLTWDQT